MDENDNLNKPNIRAENQKIDFDLLTLTRMLNPVTLLYLNSILNRESRDTYNQHKEDIGKVVLPPELIQKVNKVDYEKLSAKWYGKQVIEFAKLMEKEFPPEYLVNFYNNINDLFIYSYEHQHKELIIDSSSDTDGIYFTIGNFIIIDEDFFECLIFHELFHMASARIAKGIIFGGFEQMAIDGSFYIGKGLNEGYTQLLAERYFGHIEGVKGRYPYLFSVAGLLEEIVGAEKMTSLYLRADLPSLINELKKYVPEDEILDFLKASDFIEKHLFEKDNPPSKDALITQSLVTINEFLFKLNVVKAIKMFLHGELKDEEELNGFISEFANKIGTEIAVGNHKYTYFSEKRANEMYVEILTKKMNEYAPDESAIKK